MTSVTARLTGWYAVTVTLAVVAALGVGRLLLEREMTAGIDLLHEAEFREVIQQLRADPETLAPAELARLMAEHSAADEHLFFFQVHDEEGRVLFRSANLGDTVLPDYSEGHAVAWTTELPIYGKVRGNDFLAGRLHFQIASRVGPMAQVLRQYTQVGGLIALLVALASLGLGYVISRVALRPIRDIERTARRIGADNLNERIPAPPGRDEVAGLVKLLNAMFDRLESSFRQIARFSADASHELKTPLTLIRLNTERVRARVAGDEVAVAEVDGLLEEIARMQEIINSLLFLAKAEGGALKIAREEHAAEEICAIDRGGCARAGGGCGATPERGAQRRVSSALRARVAPAGDAQFGEQRGRGDAGGWHGDAEFRAGGRAVAIGSRGRRAGPALGAVDVDVRAVRATAATGGRGGEGQWARAGDLPEYRAVARG